MGCGLYQRFASMFGIVAKFPRRKFGNISPYFRGGNLAAFRLKCVIVHKTLSIPSFRCENTTKRCLIFMAKIWQSFAFGVLWRIGRVLCLYI